MAKAREGQKAKIHAASTCCSKMQDGSAPWITGRDPMRTAPNVESPSRQVNRTRFDHATDEAPDRQSARTRIGLIRVGRGAIILRVTYPVQEQLTLM